MFRNQSWYYILSTKELRLSSLLVYTISLLAFVLRRLSYYTYTTSWARSISLLLILYTRNQTFFRNLDLILWESWDICFLYCKDLFVQSLLGFAIDFQIPLDFKDLTRASIMEYLFLLIRQSCWKMRLCILLSLRVCNLANQTFQYLHLLFGFLLVFWVITRLG